jgi:hypothetical protein
VSVDWAFVPSAFAAAAAVVVAHHFEQSSLEYYSLAPLLLGVVLFVAAFEAALGISVAVCCRLRLRRRCGVAAAAAGPVDVD